MNGLLVKAIGWAKATVLIGLVGGGVWVIKKYQTAEAWVHTESKKANAPRIREIENKVENHEDKIETMADDIKWLVRKQGGTPAEEK